MEMTVKKENDALRVYLRGELDHHEAGAIRKELDDLLFEERPKTLIFDFSGVRFMDSSGIGLVLGRYRIVSGLGGKVTVADAPPAIAKLFKMSGVDKIVTLA